MDHLSKPQRVNRKQSSSMAVIGLSYVNGVVRCNGAPGERLKAALRSPLRRVPSSAPIVILVHGYKFSPLQAHTDPNRLVFAMEPKRLSRKIASWPSGLGFDGKGYQDGLCLGFAWPASGREQPGPVWSRFARVYDAAAEAGTALARVIEAIDAIAPGRPVDLVAHSLGARVALRAVAETRKGRIGQIVLMGGAEYTGEALAALSSRGAAGAQIYNVTSRENDVYDLLFARFGPRTGAADRPLSDGLGSVLRNAVDLPLDCPDIAPLLLRRGVTLAPELRRVCHWSFFQRPGALALYAEILRARHNWTIPALKAELSDLPRAPRWSLLLPRFPGMPPGTGAIRPV